VRSSSGSRGWVLLELLVALCLFGLAVAPLWAMLASQREAAIQLARAAADEDTAGEQEPEGLAWTWGAPQVRAVEWEAGGSPRARADGPNSPAGILLGVWVDGAFIGETEAESGGWTSLEVGLRRSLPADAQVVVRARIPEGPWGVPWRTEAPGSPAASSGGEVGPDDPAGWVTVHLPAAGEGSAEVTDSLRTTTTPVPVAGPSDVIPVSQGSVSTTTAARSQDFAVELGQHVDLYF
jgi:hypothetical protein